MKTGIQTRMSLVQCTLPYPPPPTRNVFMPRLKEPMSKVGGSTRAKEIHIDSAAEKCATIFIVRDGKVQIVHR